MKEKSEYTFIFYKGEKIIRSYIFSPKECKEGVFERAYYKLDCRGERIIVTESDNEIDYDTYEIRERKINIKPLFDKDGRPTVCFIQPYLYNPSKSDVW